MEAVREEAGEDADLAAVDADPAGEAGRREGNRSSSS